MSDGRCFTSYIPNSQMNENMKHIYKTTSNGEYRQLLQNDKDMVSKMRKLAYTPTDCVILKNEVSK
jgi:hypothetical protein